MCGQGIGDLTRFKRFGNVEEYSEEPSSLILVLRVECDGECKASPNGAATGSVVEGERGTIPHID